MLEFGGYFNMISLIRKAIPLIKWVLSGGIAILVDLLVLYVLVEFAAFHYLFATSIAFVTSASTNYTISRFVIFQGTQHSLSRSYSTFMAISLIGLGAISLCMFILVDIFGVHYLISRIIVAGTLGVSSFFLHKYFSFKDLTKY